MTEGLLLIAALGWAAGLALRVHRLERLDRVPTRARTEGRR